MYKNIKLPVFFIALLSTFFLFAAERIIIDEKYLTEVPAVYNADTGDWQGPELVRGIYYDGPEWQGKPTKIFAYIGVPKSTDGKPVPGIVLVHGGAGTAYRSWVELWVSRGYAAIAMDNCGNLPIYNPDGSIMRNPAAGPAGWENSFRQINEPLKDQWPSHVVNMIARAHTLLAAQPGVDANNIGISGISWGGYLTCLAASIDSRFKYAVPVYGCGFLTQGTPWSNTLKDPALAEWNEECDPASYLADIKMPIMWVTGTNDLAYPLDTVQRCADLIQDQPVYFSVNLRMIHGHAGHGEKPPVILAFADWMSGRSNVAFPEFSEIVISEGSLQITGKCALPITKAELMYTCEDASNGKPSPEWLWEVIPAEVANTDGKFTATVNLPTNTKQYILNIYDERNVPFSSPVLH